MIAPLLSPAPRPSSVSTPLSSFGMFRKVAKSLDTRLVCGFWKQQEKQEERVNVLSVWKQSLQSHRGRRLLRGVRPCRRPPVDSKWYYIQSGHQTHTSFRETISDIKQR